MEHLKGASLGEASVLATNIRLNWKGLLRDKQADKLRIFVNYRLFWLNLHDYQLNLSQNFKVTRLWCGKLPKKQRYGEVSLTVLGHVFCEFTTGEITKQ